ncbi:MAG: glucose 1-dehydrogenase [Candidatus Tectomicrobia bacterium]|nr:glucose 1-dehydrogenase [Candidatus Tectomicrobia bacterium]
MLQAFDLIGKTALVTGGGTGLGRVMALALTEAGADVAVAARRRERLEAAAAEIRALGRSAAVIEFDLTNPADVTRVVAEAESTLGPLDILVNNSGVSGEGWAAELPLERWDQVMATNLRGAFLMCQAAGRGMIERKGGSIVNVASVAGMIGVRMLAAYSASKGGLIQLTRTLALEWARHGVRVNALAPGYFLTDLNREHFSTEAGERMVRNHIPMGRLGQPPELAGAVVFLASGASSFMTGAVLTVDGGQSAQ